MRALLLLLAPVFLVSAAADTISLDLPVACEIGKTCFIQQYFDHDPGPGFKDYTCGIMSYDGHDGVDIRLPTLAAMRRGVDVLAAESGTVKGARDGMADVNVREAGPASVAGRECGNGVVIAHDGGWESQYCHLAKSSVRVRAGDRVEKGAPLGQIGESGDAEFPHVHFSVRRNGVKLDPFAYGAGPCGSGQMLWSAKARAVLGYSAPQVINQGFAGGPVTMDDVEQGRAEAPGTRSAALVAFVRAISLAKGDVQELKLTAPDGTALATQRTAPLDRNKAQWMLFAGKRRPAAGFAPGRYTAEYAVTRGSKVVAQRTFTLDLR